MMVFPKKEIQDLEKYLSLCVCASVLQWSIQTLEPHKRRAHPYVCCQLGALLVGAGGECFPLVAPHLFLH